MDLEGIMLTEIRETQIPYDLKKKQTCRYKEHIDVCQRQRAGSACVCEKWSKVVKRYKLLITSKHPGPGNWDVVTLVNHVYCMFESF